MLSRIGVNAQSKISVIQSFARPVSKGILRFTSLKDPTIPMRDCLQHRMFDKMHPAKYKQPLKQNIHIKKNNSLAHALVEIMFSMHTD